MDLKGSLCCLNGKVDLSTFEADATLQHWQSQLEKLKHESSLKLINREIASEVPIQACRVLAMRNGDGRLKQPELIIGSSISGVCCADLFFNVKSKAFNLNVCQGLRCRPRGKDTLRQLFFLTVVF